MSDDLLRRLTAARDPEERDLIVLRFSLASLEPAVRQAVEAAAIPHWFDAALLSALLSQPAQIVQPLIDRLATLSFVRPFPGHGHSLHDHTRAVLLRQMWRDDPDRFLELSQHAMDHCEAQDQDDPGWRTETIYHALVADTPHGIQCLHEAMSAWLARYRFDRCEAVVRVAREHADAGRLQEPALSWISYYQGSTAFTLDRRDEARRALLSVDPLVDPWLAAGRELMLGRTISGVGDPEEASRHFAAASGLARIGGFSAIEAGALLALSQELLMRDNYRAASPCLAAARAAAILAGDSGMAADCMIQLATIKRMLGEFSAARDAIEQAINTRPREDLAGQGSDQLELASYQLARSEADLAVSHCAQALPLFEQAHARIGTALGEAVMGHALREIGRYDQAREHCEISLAISRAIADRQREAYALLRLGAVDLATNAPRAAQDRLAAAMALCRELGDRAGLAECALNLGDVFRVLGEADKAEPCIAEALSIFRAIGARPGIADALMRLGHLHTETGNPASAEACFKEAADLYAACDLGHKAGLARSRLDRARRA